MKISKFFAVVYSTAIALSGAALADEDFVSDCEEFKSLNGIDGDCDCMAEAASEAGVSDEIMATTTLDDLGSLTAEALEVIDACT